MSIQIVNLRAEHAPQLYELQRACFPYLDEPELFSEDDFRHHAAYFPDLVFVAQTQKQVVGVGGGIFVDFDFSQPQHNMDDFVGGGRCENHDPNGGFYYGTDLSVHPKYRRRGIGRRLLKQRMEVVRQYNKRGLIAGGMLPGYIKHRAEMGAQEYVARVVAGDLYDPTLSFQLQNGFQVRGVIKNYFYDGKTEGWASLIVWENPDFERKILCPM